MTIWLWLLVFYFMLDLVAIGILWVTATPTRFTGWGFIFKSHPNNPAALPAWDIYPPETDYDEWLAQQRYEADLIVNAASMCFDEITHMPDVGVLSGQFPSPTKRVSNHARKRRRARKPREWAGDDKL